MVLVLRACCCCTPAVIRQQTGIHPGYFSQSEVKPTQKRLAVCTRAELWQLSIWSNEGEATDESWLNLDAILTLTQHQHSIYFVINKLMTMEK